jgi:CPA1 family monovalent cation:H+ antiporter
VHGTVGVVTGIITLLVIAGAARLVTNKLRFPFSVLLFLIGIALAVLSPRVPALTSVTQLSISPDLVLVVFLPTLVFDSAMHLNVREVRKSIGPIMVLAVLGLMVSAVVIAAVVARFSPLSFGTALLLGAVLSATDPVAVIAIFQRLGAPRRLHVLVEGESLFNDATSLVLARILAGVLVGGAMGWHVVPQGVLSFLLVFFGGVATGVLMGVVAGVVLDRVGADPLITITVTTVLAYLSFIVAEEVLRVSGVMATVAAGLTFSGWGWTKIRAAVRQYLEYFWQYVSFVANALIFILVGMSVDLASLWDARGILLWVIIGMLVSRLAVAYGVVPLSSFVGQEAPFDRGYKTVLFWGGLRGAVALAVVLSLPDFAAKELLVNLVIGSVLFTLVVQAPTIEPVVRLLGLHKRSLPDRFIAQDSRLEAKRDALDRVPTLLSGGLFSKPILDGIRKEYEESVRELEHEIASLRDSATPDAEQEQMLYLQLYGEERSAYMELFERGQIGERAYRELSLFVARRMDAVRHGSEAPLSALQYGRTTEGILRAIEKQPLLARLTLRLRKQRFTISYELAWGRFQATQRVLGHVDSIASLHVFPEGVVEDVRERFQEEHRDAGNRLDQSAEQFPEFVTALQERLARRLVLQSERDILSARIEHGALPEGLGEETIAEVDASLEESLRRRIVPLSVSPGELLSKVPFFAEIPRDAFEWLARNMTPRSYAAGDCIIQQGEQGESLFLLARGLCRVRREYAVGGAADLGTLMPGDFFGEMAILRNDRRNATVRAVSPVYVYELRRHVVTDAMDRYQAIREALRQADRARAQEQERSGDGE